MLKLYLCEWELPESEYETARIEVAVVWAENKARALKLLKDQVIGTESWEHGKAEAVEVPLHPYPHVVYSHGGYIE